MFKQYLLGAFLMWTMWLARAADLPAYPFVHVSGIAVSNVVPDVGEIDFEIVAFDAAPEQARAVVDSRLAEIRAMLEQRGLAITDLEVRDVRRELRKQDPPAQPGAEIYQVKCSVHIVMRSLTNWRDVVSALLNMPNLDGFGVAFDTSERQKIEMELLADAVKDARRKATGLMAGFGRKVGEVAGVTSGDLKNVSRAMGMAAVDSRSYAPSRGGVETDRASLLMINSLKLAQPVDVIFRIAK